MLIIRVNVWRGWLFTQDLYFSLCLQKTPQPLNKINSQLFSQQSLSKILFILINFSLGGSVLFRLRCKTNPQGSVFTEMMSVRRRCIVHEFKSCMTVECKVIIYYVLCFVSFFFFLWKLKYFTRTTSHASFALATSTTEICQNPCRTTKSWIWKRSVSFHWAWIFHEPYCLRLQQKNKHRKCLNCCCVLAARRPALQFWWFLQSRQSTPI